MECWQWWTAGGLRARADRRNNWNTFFSAGCALGVYRLSGDRNHEEERYVRNSASRLGAEVGFAVGEDYHGQGIASCLFGHLVRIARSKGLVQFDADVSIHALARCRKDA